MYFLLFNSRLRKHWALLCVLMDVILIWIFSMMCICCSCFLERWGVGICWEISFTLKQPQNLSLFILPPVNVKYYCLFHSWHALTKSTRGPPFNCCSLHSAVKWLISKAEVSCTEGQMHRLWSLTCGVIYIKNGVCVAPMQSWLQNQGSDALRHIYLSCDYD